MVSVQLGPCACEKHPPHTCTANPSNPWSTPQLSQHMSGDAGSHCWVWHVGWERDCSTALQLSSEEASEGLAPCWRGHAANQFAVPAISPSAAGHLWGSSCDLPSVFQSVLFSGLWTIQRFWCASFPYPQPCYFSVFKTEHRALFYIVYLPSNNTVLVSIP